jgi:TrmH family RNA methyltransferase
LDGEEDITNFYVVLVGAKYSGNVGAVARTMMNFDFDKLYLVNSCELDDICYARAMHAGEVLDNAKIFSTFEDAVKNMDYLVATSSIQYVKDKKHLRNPVFLRDFSEKIYEVDGNVGLVFGREDHGLFNEEIASCDIMVRIPTSESYLSLNLSHAVSIVLYALYISRDSAPERQRDIGRIEKEKLYEFFSLLIEEINYPDHKKENTEIMFKRIMGRAMPSKWEYHTLMGVLGRAVERIKNKSEK